MKPITHTKLPNVKREFRFSQRLNLTQRLCAIKYTPWGCNHPLVTRLFHRLPFHAFYTPYFISSVYDCSIKTVSKAFQHTLQRNQNHLFELFRYTFWFCKNWFRKSETNLRVKKLRKVIWICPFVKKSMCPHVLFQGEGWRSGLVYFTRGFAF